MKLTNTNVEIDAVLNTAITSGDIQEGWEHFLDIFDEFYAEDVQFISDGLTEPIAGKDRLRSELHNLLVPLHVVAEVSGLQVTAEYRQNPSGIPHEVESFWTVRFVTPSGAKSAVHWNCTRGWRDQKVIFERWYDKESVGDPLILQDFGPHQ